MCNVFEKDINLSIIIQWKRGLDSMDDIVQTIVPPPVELDEINYNYIFYMIQMC
jgi:hypothetical protein